MYFEYKLIIYLLKEMAKNKKNKIEKDMLIFSRMSLSVFINLKEYKHVIIIIINRNIRKTGIFFHKLLNL